MTILTGILAYFLITTPIAVILGDALKANRRRQTRRATWTRH